MSEQELAVVTKAPTDVVVYNPFGGVRDLGKGVEVPPEEFANLVWCTGTIPSTRLIINKDTGEQTEQEANFRGFFCDMDDARLNNAARKAMAAGEPIEELILDHEQEPKKQWCFGPNAEYYFILRSIVPWEEEKLSNKRHGLARGSRYQRDKSKERKVLWDKPRKSYAYILVFPASLVHYGYEKPLVVCVKSTQTEDLLKVLASQFQVIRFAEKYHKRNNILGVDGKPLKVPFDAYRLNVRPSTKSVPRSGELGSKKIYIMEAPLPSLNDTYLQEQEMPTTLIDLFEEYSEYSEKWSTDLVADIANKDRLAEIARDKALAPPDDADPFVSEDEDAE